MSDLISRQAAIDIERNMTVDTNPSHFEAHQKFTQFMDDAEISSFGRWQWSNGFNTALTAVGIDLKKLPSAQPEPPEECERCMMEHTDEMEKLEAELAMAQPKRGRWIKLDMHRGMADHKCSVCKQECYVPTCMGEPMYAFCPNCGSYNGGENEI